MKKVVLWMLGVGMPFASAIGANSGLIMRLDFAASTFSLHPDVVQMQIEGGFSQGACDSTFAAIRRADSHLVSAALAAKMAGAAVLVTLDQSQTYFGNRCVITAISIL